MSGRLWYVIQCKLRQESRAFEHLERQGFACYLPTLRLERLRYERRIEAQEPLFPGYIFIRLDRINQNWHPIRSTRGVIQLVRFREYAAPISDQIIHLIRMRVSGDYPAAPYLRPGERVRITEGAFANLDAIFLANDGQERVLLLMRILQHDQELAFPAGSVRKCAAL